MAELGELSGDGDGEPEQPRRGFSLSPLADDILQKASRMEGLVANLPDVARLRDFDRVQLPVVPEDPAVSLLRKQLKEERRRAQVADERSARQDGFAVQSAEREARMAQLAEIADARAAATEARQAAAEARDSARETREKHLYWVTIAGLLFALIAAVAAIITIFITN